MTAGYPYILLPHGALGGDRQKYAKLPVTPRTVQRIFLAVRFCMGFPLLGLQYHCWDAIPTIFAIQRLVRICLASPCRAALTVASSPKRSGVFHLACAAKLACCYMRHPPHALINAAMLSAVDGDVEQVKSRDVVYDVVV
jgi:hypothetical protein